MRPGPAGNGRAFFCRPAQDLHYLARQSGALARRRELPRRSTAASGNPRGTAETGDSPRGQLSRGAATRVEDTFRGRREPGQHARRPDRSLAEVAPAVGAYIHQDPMGALRTERTFKGADESICIRRQVPVAAFAVRANFEHAHPPVTPDRRTWFLSLASRM